MNKPYLVWAEWDIDANVWVATSDDVPGLVTEADTIHKLVLKLGSMVPDLLKANACNMDSETVHIELLARSLRVTHLGAI